MKEPMIKDITLEPQDLPVVPKKRQKGELYLKLEKAMEILVDELTKIIQDPEKRTASDFRNLIQLAKDNDLVFEKPDREGDPGDIESLVVLPFPLEEHK